MADDVSVNPSPASGNSGEMLQGMEDTHVFVKSRTSGISISHLNVGGIHSSIDELRFLLKDQALDVSTVSKTSLNCKISELDIEGYNLLWNDKLALTVEVFWLILKPFMLSNAGQSMKLVI